VGNGKVRLSRRAPKAAQRGLGQGDKEAEEVAAAAFFNPKDHAGPAIDVAFLSSGAAYFTHRDLVKGGLKGAFAAYDDDKECHLFEMNVNVSMALKSCLASDSNSLTSAANLFSRVSASIALDFKGQWFFKADGGNAFAMSLVISNEDGTIVVDRTEYFATSATAVLEQPATLQAGTYTIEMFAITTSKAGAGAGAGVGAGKPSLMYKNPTPCGINAWRPFRSDAQMECQNNAGDGTNEVGRCLCRLNPHWVENFLGFRS